ncbi:MAG: hemolysin III family protein [Oscillospiraceae bacterium]
MERVKRIKLADRELPDYTNGEEMFNMVSHIVGAAIGVAGLVLCVIVSALHRNTAGILTSIVYGCCVILLYTMSSIYHGLKAPAAKKVFQVIDHCTIYFMIAGSYTPLTICAIAKVNPAAGWTIFGFVWALTALAVTLTAIDLEKYRYFSMACYLGMGWCVVAAIKPAYESIPLPGFILLIVGGLFYTSGCIFYGLGGKKRWFHSIFHLFVLAGSISHLLCMLYVL